MIINNTRFLSWFSPLSGVSRRYNTGANLPRQQSATDITVYNSRLSLPLTDLAPATIEEDRKQGNFQLAPQGFSVFIIIIVVVIVVVVVTIITNIHTTIIIITTTITIIIIIIFIITSTMHHHHNGHQIVSVIVVINIVIINKHHRPRHDNRHHPSCAADIATMRNPHTICTKNLRSFFTLVYLSEK